MSQQNFRKLTALSFCIALAACGGGGGGSDTPFTQTGTGSGTNTNSIGTNSTSTPNGGTPTSPSGSSGGAGATSPTDAGSGTTPLTGTPPLDSTGGNSGSPTTTPPASPFTAQLVSAPTPIFFDEQAEGTYPNATVRFVVSGTGLRNVELVSANDASIKYGTFTISVDGTRATLDWNYQSFNYLYFDLRILAWNVPAGEAGENIEVMPARRYTRRPSPGMCAEYYRQTGLTTCGEVAP